MKLISKITILFLFITILFSIPIGSIYAEEVEQLELSKTTLNPGSFCYSFKRILEKGREKLLFSQESKKTFHMSLLKTRLSELDYVVNNKVLSEVQTSSERFAYQAGILTQELIKQNNSDEKTKLVKEFEKYGKFLANLRDKYPANSSFWMLVQHDINTLSILSEHLK